MKDKMDWCCFGKKGFPTFAVILLVVGVLWILGDTGVITVEIPWFPVVLVVVAFGWIIDSMRRGK